MTKILKGKRLYRPDHLYTGVNDVPWEVIMQYGTDRPDRRSTYAHTERGFTHGQPPLMDYAMGGEDLTIDPSIIVYRHSAFDPRKEEAERYFLREGVSMRSALVAAFKVRPV